MNVTTVEDAVDYILKLVQCDDSATPEQREAYQRGLEDRLAKREKVVPMEFCHSGLAGWYVAGREGRRKP